MNAATHRRLKIMQERLKDHACPVCGKRMGVEMKVIWNAQNIASDGLLYTKPRKKLRFLTWVKCPNCKIEKLFPFTAKSKVTSEFANFYKGTHSEDAGIKPEGDVTDVV